MKKELHGLNNKKIQVTNRSLVLDIIIRKGIISRKELADMTGLGKPTITNVVNELLEFDIVEEREKPRTKGQRKIKGLVLKGGSIRILSARWIRTRFKAAIFTLAGEMIDLEECEVSAEEEIWCTTRRILGTIDRLLSRHDEKNILEMCVGVPGPYLRAPGLNKAIVNGYDKLQTIDIQEFFESQYDFPVITEHDAHLSAFYEWESLDMEKQNDCRCMLALQSVGIGIGAGIILDGKILEGAFGIAGEIGQLGIYFNGPKNRYGERGTLEYYASSASVRRYVSERMCDFPESAVGEESSYEEIVDAYYAGDPLAVWAFDILAWRLAYGLLGTIFVINPDEIIIGPDYPVSDRFIGKIKSALDGMLNKEIGEKIKIRYSSAKEDTTLTGGYYFTLEHLINEKILYKRIKEILGVKEE